MRYYINRMGLGPVSYLPEADSPVLLARPINYKRRVEQDGSVVIPKAKYLDKGLNPIGYLMSKGAGRKPKVTATLPSGRNLGGRYPRNIQGEVAELVDALTGEYASIAKKEPENVVGCSTPGTGYVGSNPTFPSIPYTVRNQGHTKEGLQADRGPDSNRCTILCDQFFFSRTQQGDFPLFLGWGIIASNSESSRRIGL